MKLGIDRDYIRSLRGQCHMLLAAYAGAVLLALVALGLRSLFFERFVHDKHDPFPDRLAAQAWELSAGRCDPASVKQVPKADWQLLYGGWIDEVVSDPDGRLARSLLGNAGDSILERIARTLVAGNPRQRLRAIELLGWIDAAELKPEAGRLCRYAQHRAERRGEADLAQHAAEVLARLQTP